MQMQRNMTRRYLSYSSNTDIQGARKKVAPIIFCSFLRNLVDFQGET